ncbi:MAG: YadA C-terminal domain-containing protein [Rhodomicrobiaceae bacterium]
MNSRKIILFGAASLFFLPHIAFAQVINELNTNDLNEGASITSNADGSADEYFVINDNNDPVFYGAGDDETIVSNKNNVIIQYDSDDIDGGTFALTTGDDDVLTANNAGTVTVHNNMNTNGINNGNDGITNAGDVSGVTALAVDTNGVAPGGNRLTVGATHQATIGSDTFDYGTHIEGGALVDGDLGVNGSIYALNPTSSSGINVGNNGLDINGANNTTTLVADSNDTASDGRAALTLQEDQATLLVHNQTTGEAHGLSVGQSQTVLSGGTQSTSLTLDDSGATFRNTTTGEAARVTGVAAGSTTFDAVNFGQLRETNAGVASVAAMANMPGLPVGKNYSLGLGVGNFAGETAFAFGGIARMNDYVSLQASVGHSNEASTVGAGVGFSW